MSQFTWRLNNRFTVRATALLCSLLFLTGFTESDIPKERVVAVRRVIDGDTFEADQHEKVRLIGINAPEDSAWKGRVDTYGPEATRFTQALLEGKKVRLQFDKEPLDKYKRTLAYVYLENGTFVNELLVREGWARARFYFPNGLHRKELEAAENQSRLLKKGLWSGNRLDKSKGRVYNK